MKNDDLSNFVTNNGKFMDRRIKFRHLEAFSAIARARSLKTAAEELHLTQPAISRTLKELEDLIGVKLMERSRAGVHLSAEGEIFLQFAEQSTSALQQGLRSVQGAGAASGHVRIGALPSVATSLLPQATLEFSGRNPDTRLEIYEGPHADLTARLRGGGLEMVIGRLGRPRSMEGLTFRQLYAEEVVVVCRPDSPAASVRRLEDLNAYRILYPPGDSAIRPLVARLLISQGVALYGNRIESASSAFGLAVTLLDPLTVWFISRGVVAGDLEGGRLVSLRVDTSATEGAIGVMTRADEVPSVAVRAFVRALHAVADSQARAVPAAGSGP